MRDTSAAHHDAVKITWETVPANGGDVAGFGIIFLLLSDDGRVLLTPSFSDTINWIMCLISFMQGWERINRFCACIIYRAGKLYRKQAFDMDVVDLSRQDIAHQLLKIKKRQAPASGKRQEDFNSVELLICYGLFYILDPHRYGGRNIHLAPGDLHVLARFLKRSASSVTSKMLNMDGSRAHSGKDEVQIFAHLAASPDDYIALYKDVIRVARELSIGEDLLPDFLNLFDEEKASDETLLLGQEELPVSNAYLLKTEERLIKEVAAAYDLSNAATEKMIERKVRLVQHRFASAVLRNCEQTCVFCGFRPPRTLGKGNGFLRASHIKPWAISEPAERMDVRNGLAACPVHDVGFDQGYLTVEDTYAIRRASTLEQSVLSDAGTAHYFGSIVCPTLLLPAQAKKPDIRYLCYHRDNIFRG